MAIQPLNRVQTSRKDGQQTGASSMNQHTRLRLEDSEGNYVGLFDSHNTYVVEVSTLLEDLGLVVIDNVEYHKNKPATEARTLSLNPKTA